MKKQLLSLALLCSAFAGVRSETTDEPTTEKLKEMGYAATKLKITAQITRGEATTDEEWTAVVDKIIAMSTSGECPCPAVADCPANVSFSLQISEGENQE